MLVFIFINIVWVLFLVIIHHTVVVGGVYFTYFIPGNLKRIKCPSTCVCIMVMVMVTLYVYTVYIYTRYTSHLFLEPSRGAEVAYYIYKFRRYTCYRVRVQHTTTRSHMHLFSACSQLTAGLLHVRTYPRHEHISHSHTILTRVESCRGSDAPTVSHSTLS